MEIMKSMMTTSTTTMMSDVDDDPVMLKIVLQTTTTTATKKRDNHRMRSLEVSHIGTVCWDLPVSKYNGGDSVVIITSSLFICCVNCRLLEKLCPGPRFFCLDKTRYFANYRSVQTHALN